MPSHPVPWDNFGNSGKSARAARQNPRGQRCDIAPPSRTLTTSARLPKAGQSVCNRSQRLSVRLRSILCCVRFAVELF